jgi:formate hydrogenlyase subunit 4
VVLAAQINYSAAQAAADLFQIGPIVAVSVALLLAIVLDLVVPLRARGAITAGVSVLGMLAAIAAAVALAGHGSTAYHGFATGDGVAGD